MCFGLAFFLAPEKEYQLSVFGYFWLASSSREKEKEKEKRAAGKGKRESEFYRTHCTL